MSSVAWRRALVLNPRQARKLNALGRDDPVILKAAVRLTATGAPGYRETLPCRPESAKRARLLVAAALDAWGIGELGCSGMQIVAELVNNSVNHTRSRDILVVISREGRRVRIRVADKSRDVPVLRRPEDGSEEGRGILLVDTLSASWGYDRKPWGKVVWAELRMADASSPEER
ncbi:ATP-binding protein [Streptomyces decoyicus]|uniref:ATP-binding protein n=1 Tax=Streptomyces decoyicus TaxID=249567 RepID=UPI00364CD3E5